MSKFYISFFSFFMIFCFISQGIAQNIDCSCKKDLELLNTKIKKTPSYKNNKLAYNEFYSEISKKIENSSSVYDCYVLLNKLLIGLNDNHSKIYGTNKGAIDEVKNDAEMFNDFKNSDLFNLYPKPEINLDSLKTVLDSRPEADIEGVYRKNNKFTIGVFKNEEENDYKAIVLDSESEVWQPGEQIYTLVPYGNDYMLNIGGNITSKRLIAYPERIENGIFLTMGLQKDVSQTNFSVSKYTDSTYVREELSPEITYLKIGSFNSWYPTLSDAENFYQSLEGTLTKKHLILDLRDNGGGGDRNSDILFKIIKDYLKKNKVYILTNHRTASNAEQFTLKLSQFENCKTFGDRTNGTAAYELVDSNHELPCGNFVAVLTSKKHPDYLKIESVGIEPNVKFNMESDWVNQLTTFIQKNN